LHASVEIDPLHSCDHTRTVGANLWDKGID
jgi:hypothetical protein